MKAESFPMRLTPNILIYCVRLWETLRSNTTHMLIYFGLLNLDSCVFRGGALVGWLSSMQAGIEIRNK